MKPKSNANFLGKKRDGDRERDRESSDTDAEDRAEPIRESKPNQNCH